MGVRQLHYTKEEISRRGREIYESQVHSQVEEGNHGKIVAIDIETGVFEIAKDTNREAVIQIAVLSDSQQIKAVRAVIDTGYTGDLMLPRAIVDELGLSLQAIQDAILGDGSLTTFEMYAGSVT